MNDMRHEGDLKSENSPEQNGNTVPHETTNATPEAPPTSPAGAEASPAMSQQTDEKEQADALGQPSRAEKPKKKQRVPYVDDGHTIYDMSCLRKPGEGAEQNGVGLTRREKWAAIRAAFCHYIPALLITIGAFGITLLLMYLWLTT